MPDEEHCVTSFRSFFQLFFANQSHTGRGRNERSGASRYRCSAPLARIALMGNPLSPVDGECRSSGTWRRQVRRVQITLLGCLALLFAGLNVVSSSAEAAIEYRDVAWAWCLWDCGYSGDYQTPEALIGAMNAYIDQTYAQCMGSTAVSNCGGGCYKINRYSPTPSGGFAVVNGKSIFQSTAINTSTFFYPACNTRPAETIITDLGGASVAAYGKFLCPQEGGWGAVTDSQATILVNGVQTNSYHVSCTREIPEPQSCKPKYGNPISPLDKTKNESELDYASADGLLRIRRTYTSAGGGRWGWGEVGAGLIDFTGRNVSQPPNIQSMAGTIQTIPEGFYWGVSQPARVDTQRPFPLLRSQPDTGQKEAWILLADGSRTVFAEGAVGSFTTATLSKPSLTVSTLSNGDAQWLVKTARDGFSRFDNTGSLVQRTLLDGKSLTYVSQANTVTVTASPGGRSVVYAKDPVTGKYVSATLPDGRQIGYLVDGYASITSVTYPDASTKTYLYNEAANIGTTTAAPAWLTGLIDENQVRTSTFTYDGYNPISTERAGGVEKYSFNYNYDYFSPPTGSSTITMPATTATTTLWWDRGPDGERRLVSQSQPAGSGCSASSSSMTYDVNGNVASADDFNAGRVCYASDLSRNLETARVEGLTASATCSTYTPANAVLPVGARKVSTVWHPDWRLEAKVSEPGRRVTSVYNGQPDPFNANAVASCAPTTALLPDGKPIAVLCKRVEQATTDANGSLGFTAALQSGVANRVSTWTYNQYGQVLTAKSPRTDVNATTTYTYYTDTAFTGADPNAVGHTIGDLQTVTNAVGKVTTYTKYDKHGQVLEMSDPNGVVTTNTYDLRQRLLSTSVGGQTTSYTYDAAGQLLKVTSPDTSWVGYEYDPAHRQTAVKDNRGNRIEYTLDNAGNKTAESVKDPGGNLRRTLSRSIDALGRVQQTTGRE
jgi:YD repeat-containing protein